MGGLGDGVDDVLDPILEWFREIEEHAPWIVSKVLEFLVDIPQGSERDMYDLADAYSNAAQAMSDHLNNVSGLTEPIAELWSGDGAAAAFQESWSGYIEQCGNSIDSLNGMQEMTQNAGLEIEMMKYMAALNLYMLADAVYTALSTLWVPLLPEALVAGAEATCEISIKMAAKELVSSLLRNRFTEVVANFAKFLGEKALPTFLKDAGKTALTDAGKTALTDAGKTALTDAGKTALTDAGETALTDAGKTALTDAGETALTDAGKTALTDAGETALTDAGETALTDAGETALTDAGETALTDAGETALTDAATDAASAGARDAGKAGLKTALTKFGLNPAKYVAQRLSLKGLAARSLAERAAAASAKDALEGGLLKTLGKVADKGLLKTFADSAASKVALEKVREAAFQDVIKTLGNKEALKIVGQDALHAAYGGAKGFVGFQLKTTLGFTALQWAEGHHPSLDIVSLGEQAMSGAAIGAFSGPLGNVVGHGILGSMASMAGGTAAVDGIRTAMGQHVDWATEMGSSIAFGGMMGAQHGPGDLGRMFDGKVPDGKAPTVGGGRGGENGGGRDGNGRIAVDDPARTGVEPDSTVSEPSSTADAPGDGTGAGDPGTHAGTRGHDDPVAPVSHAGTAPHTDTVPHGDTVPDSGTPHTETVPHDQTVSHADAPAHTDTRTQAPADPSRDGRGPGGGDHRDPVTGDPVTRDPVTREPSGQDLNGRDPARHDPAIHDPAIHDPAIHDPATHDPASHDPATHDPSGRDPGSREPSSHDPGSDRPADRDPGSHHDPTSHDPAGHDPAGRDPTDHDPASRHDRSNDDPTGHDPAGGHDRSSDDPIGHDSDAPPGDAGAPDRPDHRDPTAADRGAPPETAPHLGEHPDAETPLYPDELAADQVTLPEQRLDDHVDAQSGLPVLDLAVIRDGVPPTNPVEARQFADHQAHLGDGNDKGAERPGTGDDPLDSSSLEQHRGPSVNFDPTKVRTGSELPRQAHELIEQAKARLLGKYPESAVADRIADLDRIDARATDLERRVARARSSGDLRDLIAGVREFSRAVNEYGDRYGGWRDFERGGEAADPGWRDLDGVDPLNSTEMANRTVQVDPETHHFHVLDQAIAIAKIGDVLGPEFEQHATRMMERAVPRDMESVQARLGPDIASELAPVVNDPATKGVYHSRHNVTLVDARDGNTDRSISAVAATIVHESMHAVQPRMHLVGESVERAVAGRPDSRAARQSVEARLMFEREYQAFTVQQHFLRGLSGFHGRADESDIRYQTPRTDHYRELASETPEAMRDRIIADYIEERGRFDFRSARDLLGTDDILADNPDLAPENVVERARQAIVDAYTGDEGGTRQGGLDGPITRRIAEEYGLDLDGIRDEQAGLRYPEVHNPRVETGSEPEHGGHEAPGTGRHAPEREPGAPKHSDQHFDQESDQHSDQHSDQESDQHSNQESDQHSDQQAEHERVRHDPPEHEHSGPSIEQRLLGPHETELYQSLHDEVTDIAHEQEQLAEELKGDGKYWFAKVYHHVTTRELEMIDGGRYEHPIMKMQEVVAFHATYRDNLQAWREGRHEDVEPTWRLAFKAAEESGEHWRPLPSLNIMDALLPSMQAHIRFDLPRAIAHVYERNYAGTGVSIEEFRADYDRMQPVFDQASADLRPEIAAQTFAVDPGQYGFVQDHGFRVIFDVPGERQRAWERAMDIVSLHQAGITDHAEMQPRLEEYSRAAHPLKGRTDFKIGGEKVRDYDWSNQPEARLHDPSRPIEVGEFEGPRSRPGEQPENRDAEGHPGRSEAAPVERRQEPDPAAGRDETDPAGEHEPGRDDPDFSQEAERRWGSGLRNRLFGRGRGDEGQDPAGQEPAGNEPTGYDQRDPMRTDPTRSDPTRQAPTWYDPTRPDPFAHDPSRQDPFGYDPGRQDPWARDPNQQDPWARDPNQQDPWARDPGRQDPFGYDPSRPDPFGHQPETPGPGHGGSDHGQHVPADGRDHSTHDEIWSDPAWVREGRRPTLDELVPRSDEEADAWKGDVERYLIEEVTGQTYAGMRVEPTLSQDPVNVGRDSVIFHLNIRDSEGHVGHLTYLVERDQYGHLVARHNTIVIDRKTARGGGFARDFNEHMEGWYRESGVSHIELHASWEVGGYAWARAGYDWQPGSQHRADKVFDELAKERRLVDNDADALERWLAGDAGVDGPAIMAKYHASDPDALLADLRWQSESVNDVLSRRHLPFGSEHYPTPFEVSQAGWHPGLGRGTDATWIGKRTLLNSNTRGSDWYGFKVVSPENLSPALGHYLLSRQVVPEMAHTDAPVGGAHSDAYPSGEPDTRAGPVGGEPIGGEPDAGPPWSSGGRSLTGEQNRYADDVLLNSTYNDEGIRSHLDLLSDDRVVHARTPGDDPDAFKARFADVIARSGPDQSLARSAEEAGGVLRYEIDLPEGDYTGGAQRVIDGLAARGYEPVRVDGWTADRPGIETRWRDPDTGQVFDVSLDTRASYDSRLVLDRLDNDLAKNLDPDQRAHLETLRADIAGAVHMPEAADRVGLPGDPAREPEDWAGGGADNGGRSDGGGNGGRNDGGRDDDDGNDGGGDADDRGGPPPTGTGPESWYGSAADETGSTPVGNRIQDALSGRTSPREPEWPPADPAQPSRLEQVLAGTAGEHQAGEPQVGEPGDGGTDPYNVIHAAAVPGGDFNGHGEQPSELHRLRLLSSAPDAITAAVAGHGGLTETQVGPNRWEIRLPDGGSFTVRVDVQWHGFDAAAESHLNHDKAQHVIQLSDQLPVDQVERAVSHEIGEIVADRERYLADEPGNPPDTLRPGEFEPGARLSPHDAGRVQELRVLGSDLSRLPGADARTPEQEAAHERLLRSSMALVEHLGLRDGTPGAAERRELVLDRVDPAQRRYVERVLAEAGRAEEAMSPDEREALSEVRAAAEVDQARLDLHEAALAPKFERPIALDGGHVTPEQTRTLADQATAARAERSAGTLRTLREQAAQLPPGEHPKARVQVGGGASLAGRDPGTLLVDSRGRWQADNGTVIAQTADQLRNLNRTGIGDPYQFVRPGERVPLDAVRYWEDSIAAAGPVVDGSVTLRMGENGALLADIVPADGSEPVTVEVDGTPVIASGFPPEAIVGVDRRIGGVWGTFNKVSTTLDAMGDPAARAAKAQIDGLAWYDHGSAARTMEILGDHGIDLDRLTPDAVTSLRAIDNWHQLRQADPGRVLTGDEANLRGTDPDAAQRWVVAGTGGTAISGIENMLRESDTAKFVMVGTRPPRGLGDNTQWKEVRAQHDRGYDPADPAGPSRQLPDGSWPNPTATGRLEMVFGKFIEGVDVVAAPDGSGPSHYSVAGVEGDGVIVSLGGRPGVAPAVADMVDAALKRDPGSVTGEMIFDHDGQYLGYRLTIGDHTVDVTGAASRFYPGDPIFDRRPGRVYDHPGGWPDDGQPWRTDDHRYALVTDDDPGEVTTAESASERDAPPESGNFDGGYVATAVQVTHYAAFAHGPDLSHAALGHTLGGAYRAEADPEGTRAAIESLLATPELLPHGATVDADTATVWLGFDGRHEPFGVTFETAPVHDGAVLHAEGREYAPTARVDFRVDPGDGRVHAVVRVSENASADHVRRGVAASLAEIDTVVRTRFDGVRTDQTSALLEGSRPDDAGGYTLAPSDSGRLAAMRTLAHDLVRATEAGDARRVAQLRADAVSMAIEYGLDARHAPPPVAEFEGNRPVVGEVAVQARHKAIAEAMGDEYGAVAPVADILDGKLARGLSDPIRGIRAEDRRLLAEGAEALIRQRHAADIDVTQRVRDAQDAGAVHVFQRLVLGTGWAATADYVNLQAPGDTGHGLPEVMCVGANAEPWLGRGELGMGQIPTELEMRGLPFQPAHFADEGSLFTKSADFGLAIGASRAISGAPTYLGDATAIEARPAGEAPGWPDGARYRVTVDGRAMYTAAVDVATGPGPARIPGIGDTATGRLVDPGTGFSAELHDGSTTYRDPSGAVIAAGDLPPDVRTRFGIGPDGGALPGGPLLADGAGRLTDPRVVHPDSGVSVDTGTGQLYDPQGRPVGYGSVDPAVRRELGFADDGTFTDPRFIDDPSGYSVHPVTGEIVRTADRAPVDPASLDPDVRGALDAAVQQGRVQFGGHNLAGDYRPEDRVLVYGAGASGAWDVEQAAMAPGRHVEWAALDTLGGGPHTRAEVDEVFRHAGGNNRRNNDEHGAFSDEVWDRVPRSLRSPVEVLPTTDGRLRVRFSTGETEVYDRVVISIGQESTYPGGAGHLVAGHDLWPLYGTGGEVDGLRDAAGTLRVLGAASVARGTVERLPVHLRDTVSSIVADQASTLPYDSRGIQPSIRHHAGRIAEADLPLPDFQPQVVDPVGHLTPAAGVSYRPIADHLAQDGLLVRGLGADDHVHGRALLRDGADDAGRVALLRSVTHATADDVRRDLHRELLAARHANAAELVLDGRAIGLTRGTADAAYRAFAEDEPVDVAVRFLLADGELLLPPWED